METSKMHRQAEADRAELKLKIIEEGMGSGLKWNQIATSAMANNATAKAPVLTYLVIQQQCLTCIISCLLLMIA